MHQLGGIVLLLGVCVCVCVLYYHFFFASVSSCDSTMAASIVVNREFETRYY